MRLDKVQIIDPTKRQLRNHKLRDTTASVVAYPRTTGAVCLFAPPPSPDAPFLLHAIPALLTQCLLRVCFRHTVSRFVVLRS